jgi:hypothetical protein
VIHFPHHEEIFGDTAVFGKLAAVGSLAGQTAPSNPPESRVTAQDAGKSGGRQTGSQQGNAKSPPSAPVIVQAKAASEQYLLTECSQ